MLRGHRHAGALRLSVMGCSDRRRPIAVLEREDSIKKARDPICPPRRSNATPPLRPQSLTEPSCKDTVAKTPGKNRRRAAANDDGHWEHRAQRAGINASSRCSKARLELVRQRIGPNLDMHGKRQTPLAPFLQPRRTIALRRP